MKAITNVLKPSFNNAAIDAAFDFYQIKTDQKYFSKGARVLDIQQVGIKFKGIVFENGRSIFAFCEKGAVSRLALIETINDGSVTIKEIPSTEVEERILLKLFLFSLNCPSGEGASFNNLAGKLYIYLDGLNSSSKTLKVLTLDVDKTMGLQISATSFTPASQFQRERIKEEPRYVFSHEHLSFKRVFAQPEEKNAYIRKTRFGRKTEVPFLKFNKPEKTLTKTYWIYKVLKWLREEYSPYLTVSFESAEILKKVTVRKDTDFVEKAIASLSLHPCCVINLAGENHDERAETMRDALENRLGFPIRIEESIQQGAINFCLIHNKEYYEEWKEEDPKKNFPSDVVVQCVAIEDGFVKVAKSNGAVIDTILKEAAIKADIIRHKRITLDDWGSFDFAGDWTFMTTNNACFYAMIVHVDGSFEFKVAKDDFIAFNDKELNSISTFLSGKSETARTIVKDSHGNISLISGTGLYSLPDEGIFASSVSRSKESRNRYLGGVVDINLFEFEGKKYYNAGMVGAGMNTDVPKAAPFYEVSVIEGTEDIIDPLLETMAVVFVKFKSFTVLPYPFKYLREYLELVKTSK